MGYYCNICRKDITREEFFYSSNKFDRPLCREHQELERRNQEKSFRVDQQEGLMVEQEPSETHAEEIIDLDETNKKNVAKSGWKSLGKKVAVKMGKGVIKGVKKVADSSKKRSQIRKWKNHILRRMTMSQLKRLCFERKISTKKTVLKEDERSEEVYFGKRNCSKGELVSKLKSKAPLDAIISFAKRNRMNIRDIIGDIERKKAEWKVKEIIEKIDKNGRGILLELEKTIRKFVPMRQYDKEIYYQDSLASFLKSKFPDTKIEVSRGSTRPDIVVRGIAIEIKGPTHAKDLISIADKCLRYKQYFPNGMLCVLFSVNVSHRRYEDWLKGMNKHHPDVVVIKI